ncbi:MAG: MFS transporter [Pseudomonadota bacterium]
MSEHAPRRRRVPAFAAFGVRSFRYQFSADLCTAWAIEMEVLVLAWYVLVETDSAFMVALIGVARFAGTLVTPWFGTLSDRLPRKAMLLGVRALFTVLAIALAGAALSGALRPWHAFAVATVSGLFRPADMMLRQSLIGDTVAHSMLVGAMGFARTTLDTARIVGALAGGAIMAALGIGTAYVVVAVFYLSSTLLSLGIAAPMRNDATAASQSWRDFKAGLDYVAHSPKIHSLLWLAFLVNFAGLCVTGGLLPVVARDVYAMDEVGLGFLVATFATGALVGSISVATILRGIRAESMMALAMVVWHLALGGFAFTERPSVGIPLLGFIGFWSSLVMVPLSSSLLAITHRDYRGRIMGLRQLAVVGLPLGLLGAGTIVELAGTTIAIAAVGLVGVGSGVGIHFSWRRIDREHASLHPVRADSAD